MGCKKLEFAEWLQRKLAKVRFVYNVIRGAAILLDVYIYVNRGQRVKEGRKELRKGAQFVIIQLSKDGEDLPTDYSWLTNVKIGVDGAKKEEITQLLEKHKKHF